MRMEAGSLPRKAYNMLANVHNNGRQCWVSAVHGNLMMYGFGYVWANQGVQNVMTAGGKDGMTEFTNVTGIQSAVYLN